MTDIDIPDIGPADLDAVLAFLPTFTQPGYAFGEWRRPEGRFPYYEQNRDVGDFVSTLYDRQVVFSFDWPSWQDEAERLFNEPGALAAADLLTLRKLLTTHVRKERFSEGHLAHMLESGHITAILRRLQEIRDEMES
jgi:hypothetical protein